MKGARTRDSYGLVAIVTATSSIPCDMCANSCGRLRGEGEQLRSGSAFANPMDVD
jgi:hypothetical protein